MERQVLDHEEVIDLRVSMIDVMYLFLGAHVVTALSSNNTLCLERVMKVLRDIRYSSNNRTMRSDLAKLHPNAPRRMW